MHRSSDIAQTWFLALVCWAMFGLVVWTTRGSRAAAESVRGGHKGTARSIAKGARWLLVVVGVVCVAVTVAAIVATV